MSRALPRLWAISDLDQQPDFAAAAAAMAAALPGRIGFQVRARSLDGGALVALARAVIAGARAHDCPVVINDRLDVALAAGADGVQLPEAGLPVEVARALMGPRALIGASRHDATGARAAIEAGADFVLVGPIWPTPSKPGHPGVGTALLAELARAPAAVYALGGVDQPARARRAIQAGAHGVAAIRGLASVERATALAAAVYGEQRS